MSSSVDWAPVLWSGVFGSAIGVIGAVGVSFFITRWQVDAAKEAATVQRAADLAAAESQRIADRELAEAQRKADRDLARKERKVSAASALLAAIGELRAQLYAADGGSWEDHRKVQDEVMARWMTLFGLARTTSLDIAIAIAIDKVSDPPIAPNPETFGDPDEVRRDLENFEKAVADRSEEMRDVLLDGLFAIVNYIELSDKDL